MHRNIDPARIQSALFATLARHGVAIDTETQEAVMLDLSTGSDPRPANLPESFTFKGLTLTWPAGRETRALTGEEFTAINTALAAQNNSLLREDDNVRVARLAYATLFNRTQFDNGSLYDPTPIVQHVVPPQPVRPGPSYQSRMAALLAEATGKAIDEGRLPLNPPQHTTDAWATDIPEQYKAATLATLDALAEEIQALSNA